jgi:hypothetical protein
MEDKQDLFEFQIDHQGREELTELTRWSKMQAIAVLSMIGLVFFTFLFAWRKLGFALSLSMTDESEAERVVLFVAVVFGVVALIIITTMYFLIRASNRIRIAVRTQDRGLLNRGLSDLRAYFAIFGVISIVMLFINLLSLI